MFEQLILTLKFYLHEGLIKALLDSMCQTFESSFEPGLRRVTETHTNLRVPAQVYDVEGGAIFAKNSTFVFFDGFAWTPRLRSPSPVMAPDKTDH